MFPSVGSAGKGGCAMDTAPKQRRGKYIFKYYARACVKRYFQDDVGRESAALAYYLLFSMFPLMIFFSMLLGYAHLNQSPLIEGLYDFLPMEVAGMIADYLRHVSSMQFGPMALVVLFFCLWFPMRATNSAKDWASGPPMGSCVPSSICCCTPCS